VRIYAAISAGGSEWWLPIVLQGAYPDVLVAFPYEQKESLLALLDYRPRSVLSDSGAFTVWQKGGSVDLDAYIGWCLNYAAQADAPPIVNISLDVIPGNRGRRPTIREREQGMRQSLRNGDRMRAAGLTIMEVYHQWEPVQFFNELLDRRQPGDLIGIAARQGLGHAARRRFCDAVFAHVLRRDTLPPLHGLGIGNRDLIFRYPWFSVDSSNWKMEPIFGRGISRRGKTMRLPVDPTHHVLRYQCQLLMRRWQRWAVEATDVWRLRGVEWKEQPA
jgi:hypothetical protein